MLVSLSPITYILICDLGFPFHLGNLTGLKILVLWGEIKCQAVYFLHIIFLDIIGVIFHRVSIDLNTYLTAEIIWLV